MSTFLDICLPFWKFIKLFYRTIYNIPYTHKLAFSSGIDCYFSFAYTKLFYFRTKSFHIFFTCAIKNLSCKIFLPNRTTLYRVVKRQIYKCYTSRHIVPLKAFPKRLYVAYCKLIAYLRIGNHRNILRRQI